MLSVCVCVSLSLQFLVFYRVYRITKCFTNVLSSHLASCSAPTWMTHFFVCLFISYTSLYQETSCIVGFNTITNEIRQIGHVYFMRLFHTS